MLSLPEQHHLPRLYELIGREVIEVDAAGDRASPAILCHPVDLFDALRRVLTHKNSNKLTLHKVLQIQWDVLCLATTNGLTTVNPKVNRHRTGAR